jgi:hypothetical protein
MMIRRALAGSEGFTASARLALTSDGIGAAFACAVPHVIPTIGGWNSNAAAAAAYLVIVDHLGHSGEGFPILTEGVGDFDELRRAALKAFAVAGVTLAPLGAYLLGAGIGFSELHEFRGIMLLFVLPPLAYAPAAILAVVVTGSASGALWPVIWFRIVSSAPSSYARLLAVFIPLGIAWCLCNVAATALVGRIPILGALLIGSVSNVILFAQASVVGGFLRANGRALGYE